MHTLVVEGDRSLADLMRRSLIQERHCVDVVFDGHDGLERAQCGAYDAIIIDGMLPGIDGLEIVRHLRADNPVVPVLMVSARNALRDRLQGFDAGADDYLATPFACEELCARLRAIARRRSREKEGDRLAAGDLMLDAMAHEVYRARRLVPLAPKEFALLECLMRHPGQVLSRSTIIERVWGYGFDALDNVVDGAIRRLRKAVDDGFDQQLIITVRGLGYKIKA
jgi:DNA-binding response OmpR family regulator